MSSVSRDKYESLKKKASQWRDKALDYQKMYEDILEENNKLISENDDLQDRLVDLPESDHSRETELEQKNEELREQIEILSKKYKDKCKRLRQLEKQKETQSLFEEMSKHFVKKQ